MASVDDLEQQYEESVRAATLSFVTTKYQARVAQGDDKIREVLQQIGQEIELVRDEKQRLLDLYLEKAGSDDSARSALGQLHLNLQRPWQSDRYPLSITLAISPPEDAVAPASLAHVSPGPAASAQSATTAETEAAGRMPPTPGPNTPASRSFAVGAAEFESADYVPRTPGPAGAYRSTATNPRSEGRVLPTPDHAATVETESADPVPPIPGAVTGVQRTTTAEPESVDLVSHLDANNTVGAATSGTAATATSVAAATATAKSEGTQHPNGGTPTHRSRKRKTLHQVPVSTIKWSHAL